MFKNQEQNLMKPENKISLTTLSSLIGNPTSINDLRDREFNGDTFSENEIKALVNFDQYRISELNKQTTEEGFHKKYMQLQVMANLAPFEEFLKDIYSGK